jgi:hypothetical protein
MREWSMDDSDALFRQPSDTPVDDDRSGEFDSSVEAMRRLRFPFEVNAADFIEQHQGVPVDEDDYRR